MLARAPENFPELSFFEVADAFSGAEGDASLSESNEGGFSDGESSSEMGSGLFSSSSSLHGQKEMIRDACKSYLNYRLTVLIGTSLSLYTSRIVQIYTK